MSSPAAASPGRTDVSAATFEPPGLSPRTVARPRLESRLGPSVATKATIVTGPAGSGKTTLVRSWVETTSFAWSWITVDPAIARSDRFWVAFVRAVHRALPDAVFDVDDVIGADTVDGHAVALALVEDLFDLPTDAAPVVVVIDDAHLLEADTWQDLEWVVNHQPASLHLMVTSRSDPPFPVARLRTVGDITEVRQHDLMMSLAETTAVVREWAGGPLDAESAAALHARTEGWAAGIRLTALSLERGATVEDLLTRHDPAGGLVAELLICEALDHQPDDVRTFLRLTSVVSVLEPDLCDALTGRHDSRDVLRRLARDHIFVVPLDGALDRYRYHSLFAEILRAEMRGGATDAEADQHVTAARWYQSVGRHPDAITHALAGHDDELAFDLIIGNLGDLYAQGHRNDAGRWLLAMPDRFVTADPDRIVDHCAALLFLVRPEWMRWHRRAWAMVGDDRPDLQARLHLFGALAVGGQGHLDEFDAHVHVARGLRPAEMTDPFDEVIDAWRARLLVLHGRVDEAVETAQRVYRAPRMMLRDIPVAALLAAVLHAAGEIIAEAMIDDVVAQWRRAGEPDFLGMADALTIASERALRRGDDDEAENLAAGAVAVSVERPTHLLGARAEIALADVEAATGRVDVARDRLRALRERMLVMSPAAPLIELLDSAVRRVAATQNRSPTPALVDDLTARELTILSHLATHHTFPEIGHQLYISRHTVKTHVARIYRKLDVATRSDAVRTAADLGLLPRP